MEQNQKKDWELTPEANEKLHYYASLYLSNPENRAACEQWKRENGYLEEIDQS